MVQKHNFCDKWIPKINTFQPSYIQEHYQLVELMLYQEFSLLKPKLESSFCLWSWEKEEKAKKQRAPSVSCYNFYLKRLRAHQSIDEIGNMMGLIFKNPQKNKIEEGTPILKLLKNQNSKNQNSSS